MSTGEDTTLAQELIFEPYKQPFLDGSFEHTQPTNPLKYGKVFGFDISAATCVVRPNDISVGPCLIVISETTYHTRGVVAGQDASSYDRILVFTGDAGFGIEIGDAFAIRQEHGASDIKYWLQSLADWGDVDMGLDGLEYIPPWKTLEQVSLSSGPIDKALQSLYFKDPRSVDPTNPWGISITPNVDKDSGAVSSMHVVFNIAPPTRNNPHATLFDGNVPVPDGLTLSPVTESLNYLKSLFPNPEGENLAWVE